MVRLTNQDKAIVRQRVDDRINKKLEEQTLPGTNTFNLEGELAARASAFYQKAWMHWWHKECLCNRDGKDKTNAVKCGKEAQYAIRYVEEKYSAQLELYNRYLAKGLFHHGDEKKRIAMVQQVKAFQHSYDNSRADVNCGL